MLSCRIKNQYFLYVFLVLIVACSAFSAYRLLRSEWIDFRSGERLFQKEQYKEAISFYEEALKKGANSPLLCLHLAESYVAGGNFAAAIPRYQKFLDVYPDNQSVRLALAKALAWNGNFVEAERELTQILKMPKE